MTFAIVTSPLRDRNYPREQAMLLLLEEIE